MKLAVIGGGMIIEILFEMGNEIRKVVVAGPNGTLGQPVLHHLQKAGFNITLLSRNVDTTEKQFPGLKAVHADYESVEALTQTLLKIVPQDALVILINRNQADSQIKLMTAAAGAGIPHIVPSAFGIGTKDPFVRELPIWQTKVQVQDYVEKATKEGRFTHTSVETGAFLDWAISRRVFVNLTGEGPMIIFDGGDVPFSATVMDDIGRAVAAALKKADQLRNRTVFVHSAVVTQNQLLSYARELAPEQEFKVIHADSGEMAQQAWDKWNNGERGPEVMRGFMPRATFGKGLGWFKETDNDLLGIEQWSDEQTKYFIANYLKQ